MNLPGYCFFIYLCRNLVYPADALGTFLYIAIERLWSWHGQHGGADTCAVHKGDVPPGIPFGQWEGFFQFRPVRFQHLHEFGEDDVGVDIYRLLCPDR